MSDFLSGASGEVSGPRRVARAALADMWADGLSLLSFRPLRLQRAARAWPRRRVLALTVERTGVPNLLPRARAELLRSRHRVEFATKPAGRGGKFENLNKLLEANPVEGHDWLLLVDDDVALPHGFLDSFLFLAERFSLQLAQPAHRARSHAAWEITRRRPTALVRETAFVEIGPVTALHASTFGVLLPLPLLRAGWGLDVHWSALARDHGWRMGVIDATPVRHDLRPVAASYEHDDALAEAREFLAHRRYVTATEAARTLAEHRSWR